MAKKTGTVSLFLPILILLLAVAATTATARLFEKDDATLRKEMKCVKTAKECHGLKVAQCCNKTIEEIFTVDTFEKMFGHRNAPTAHAQGFWDYHFFITAIAMYGFNRTTPPRKNPGYGWGFASVGGEEVQKRELAAFFAHVATDTSCATLMTAGASAGPTDENAKYQWGLCYSEELSPVSTYCDSSEGMKLLYPCAPGASYHGRGALPVYWNFNYAQVGEALKTDLLKHPDYVSGNATLGFATALWRWMTPMKPRQPSAHDVMVGKWVPTKNDTLEFRAPGFGMTVNILKADLECGPSASDAQKMTDRVGHYMYFLDLLEVGRERAGDNVYCTEQKPLNPTTSASS